MNGGRQFGGFHKAILDPDRFHGRARMLEDMIRYVGDVQIVLGGPRSGTTSVLHALEWQLLDPSARRNVKPFPVYLNLGLEGPNNFEAFLYLMVARLRQAINRWEKGPGAVDFRGRLRDIYTLFISSMPEAEVVSGFFTVKLKLPAVENTLSRADFRRALERSLFDLRELGFDGFCYLFDDADYAVKQDWANEAWGFLRDLVESDHILSPYMGFVVSGYRSLDRYRQPRGSAFAGIAHERWLMPLEKEDVDGLVQQRTAAENCTLDDESRAGIHREGGGHPALTQHLLSALLYDRRAGARRQFAEIALEVLVNADREFSKLWNVDKAADTFSEEERRIYLALLDVEAGDPATLAQQLQLSVIDATRALKFLCGAAVVRWVHGGRYEIGSQLFRSWVADRARSGAAQAET